MTYYLENGTKKEAMKVLDEIVDYYDKNADMSLEFNQYNLLFKIYFISDQVRTEEYDKEYYEYEQKQINWIKNFRKESL